ncbi:hypothetical protein CPC08DRAFT_724597 [Agrocybe pediades]|nr:hypothetical protein CPC08DRAFT_724597 [Agrocybe pediades]
MPVTFKVAHHGSTKVNPSSRPLKNANELLAETWGRLNGCITTNSNLGDGNAREHLISGENRELLNLYAISANTDFPASEPDVGSWLTDPNSHTLRSLPKLRRQGFERHGLDDNRFYPVPTFTVGDSTGSPSTPSSASVLHPDTTHSPAGISTASHVPPPFPESTTRMSAAASSVFRSSSVSSKLQLPTTTTSTHSSTAAATSSESQPPGSTSSALVSSSSSDQVNNSVMQTVQAQHDSPSSNHHIISITVPILLATLFLLAGITVIIMLKRRRKKRRNQNLNRETQIVPYDLSENYPGFAVAKPGKGMGPGPSTTQGAEQARREFESNPDRSTRGTIAADGGIQAAGEIVVDHAAAMAMRLDAMERRMRSLEASSVRNGGGDAVNSEIGAMNRLLRELRSTPPNYYESAASDRIIS